MKRLANMLSKITKAIESGEAAPPGDDSRSISNQKSIELDAASAETACDPVIERLNVASEILHPTVRASQIPVNIELPGYTIVGEIGRGGQAVVFEAIQDSTGQKVAIKILLHGVFASHHDVVRFAREIQILAALNHPYIVRVIDRGATSQGIQYLVMAFVPGLPLTHILQKVRQNTQARIQPQDLERLLRLFLKVCDAVNSAHLRGVVHRDLKPANILVDDNGDPHILDFGLARTVISIKERPTDETLSIAGQFIGSLPWACPEQALGEHDKIDTRSDVYSLGVILFQILAGEFPYDVSGPMHEVIHNIVNKPPASTVHRTTRSQTGRSTSVLSSLSTGSAGHVLDAIVHKALSKDRKNRYQTAGELARDVSDCLQGKPTQAAGDQTGHRRWVQFGAGVLIAGTLVLAAFVIGRQFREPPEQAPLSPAPVLVPALAPAQAPDTSSPVPPVGPRPDPGVRPDPFARPPAPIEPTPVLGPPIEHPRVSIGIATEEAKVGWFQAAATSFSKTPRGRNVDVNVITMSVVSSIRAVQDVDRRINLLAPANSYHNKVFVEDWRRLNGRNLILRSECVAVSPLVFLVSKKMLAFRGVLGSDLSTRWIHEHAGSRPSDPGIRFGVGSPMTTGSGIAALALMAYEFRGKTRDLSLADVQDTAFTGFLTRFTSEGSYTFPTIEALFQLAVLTDSTRLDAVILPENAIIQKLRQSPGFASAMSVAYPRIGIVNDQMVYVLDVPWSNGDQRTAAIDFVDFLLAEPAQRQAMAWGLRPVNAKVGIGGPDSPLIQYADVGLRVQLNEICDPPSEPVIEALEAAWRKSAIAGQ